jgi:hypothetical protein
MTHTSRASSSTALGFGARYKARQSKEVCPLQDSDNEQIGSFMELPLQWPDDTEARASVLDVLSQFPGRSLAIRVHLFGIDPVVKWTTANPYANTFNVSAMAWRHALACITSQSLFPSLKRSFQHDRLHLECPLSTLTLPPIATPAARHMFLCTRIQTTCTIIA